MLSLQTDYVAVIDDVTCDCSRGECCRACLRECSTGGLMWVPSDHQLLVDPWSCEGCGNCVTACPLGAITLHTRRSA